MSIQIVTKLSSRERAKKTEEAKKWLAEQGELPDLAVLRQTLLEAHSLIQALNNTLHEQGNLNSAASKITSNLEQIIANIKL